MNAGIGALGTIESTKNIITTSLGDPVTHAYNIMSESTCTPNNYNSMVPAYIQEYRKN
jgi:hypothetical protein